MFKNIINLIINQNYEEATKQLEPFLLSDNEEENSYANYLAGVINTRHDNKEKNKRLARECLQRNINSRYPKPMAFFYYAEVLEDTNVALNYLQKGITLFPKEERLWKKKLELSSEKKIIIDEIIELNFAGYELLVSVLKELVGDNKDWNLVGKIIERIQDNNQLSVDKNNFFNLVKAYSLLFKETPEYIRAIDLLETVIENDLDNRMAYSHYIAIIYALRKMGDKQKADTFFDKIPVNNSLQDLFDGPWFVVPVVLLMEYKKIFEYLIKEYSKDVSRKNKAKELYSLYLYYPSELYGEYRYKKSDINVLQKSLDYQFNKFIAVALFDMYLHKKEYISANKIVLRMLENDVDVDYESIYYEDVIDKAKEDELPEIINDINRLVKSQDILDLFNINKYITTVFNVYVEQLFDRKEFQYIVDLANELTESQIMNSGKAFQCAYSYKKQNQSRAENIYKLMLEKEPSNSSVINNLGVIIEEKGNIDEALNYFLRAVELEPDEKIFTNNLSRLKTKQKEIQAKIRKQKELEIKRISKEISLKNLEKIGYTEDLIGKFDYVKDVELRTILLRDFRECAIAICTGQEKSAIVMCGSMIETLLLASIQKVNINDYDIGQMNSNNNSNKNVKKVTDMGLNELLYVADKEKIIQKANYHLSHYVRDYRNAVHPAKEIRGKQDISKENALLMWNALKRVILDLLHE